MEMKKDAPDVPDFKLAKVGERKRRKKGALPFFFGPGGRGSGAFMGGMGGAGGLSALGGKIAVSLLVCVLGAGAYSVGKILAPQSGKFEAAKKPRPFASAQAEKPRYEGDLSNLPGNGRPGQSGLGMVSGSLDGLTPEERAAKAREEEAAAKAAAEAQAKADAEANKEPVGQAGAAVDPAAMAAAAAAAAAGKEPGKGMSRKFGELGKGLGGLAGGSGLSGGVNRGFDMPKLKGDQGKLLAFSNRRPNVNYAQRRAVNAPRSGGKGLARRQLDSAYNLSSQARKGGDESRASNASSAFDNNPAGGTAITGAGAGESGKPGAGQGDAITPNPVSGGGGTTQGGDTSPDDCDALFPDGGYISSPEGGCVKAEQGVSVDPTDAIVKILKMLLIIATILAAIQMIISHSYWGPVLDGFRLTIWNALGYAIMGIGAIIGILGIVLVGMGRPIEGTIYAGIGALMGVVAWWGASSAVLSANQVAAAVAVPLISSFGGSVFANNMHARTFNNDTQRWE